MILIAPWPKALRNSNVNHPKSYPYWQPLIDEIRILYPLEKLVQIGTNGESMLSNMDEYFFNRSLADLKLKLEECKTWISVDSFFQHFAWKYKKRGIVLFGQSDPNIFGHSENINIYKDRSYFRKQQFWMWEQAEYIEQAFVKPDVVMQSLSQLLK